MNNKIFFISEVAQGYEGDLHLAKKLIYESSKAGAHIVKFQLVYADEIATKDYTHYNFFRKLELTKKQWQTVVKTAKNLKLKIYFDIFGVKSLNLSEEIGVDGIKIHPTDINNINLIKSVNKSKIKNVILGIGGASLIDIKKAVKILNKNLTVMIGFQSYPTPNKEINLNKLIFLRKILNKKISLGYADHSIKDSASAILPAICLGATFIEKHLTLKSKIALEDSESAIYKNEFKELIKSSKFASEAIGNSKNKLGYFLSKNETKYKKNIQRSLVLNKSLLKNTKIKKNNIFDLKRTSIKNTFSSFNQIKNKVTKYNLKKNTPIEKKHIHE